MKSAKDYNMKKENYKSILVMKMDANNPNKKKIAEGKDCINNTMI